MIHLPFLKMKGDHASQFLVFPALWGAGAGMGWRIKSDGVGEQGFGSSSNFWKAALFYILMRFGLQSISKKTKKQK